MATGSMVVDLSPEVVTPEIVKAEARRKERCALGTTFAQERTRQAYINILKHAFATWPLPHEDRHTPLSEAAIQRFIQYEPDEHDLGAVVQMSRIMEIHEFYCAKRQYVQSLLELARQMDWKRYQETFSEHMLYDYGRRHNLSFKYITLRLQENVKQANQPLATRQQVKLVTDELERIIGFINSEERGSICSLVCPFFDYGCGCLCPHKDLYFP